MSSSNQRPISALHVGDSAVIHHFADTHVGGGHKLMALGLTPGTSITVTRIAPFADPIIIRLRGFKLALRKADLDGIWVSHINEN